MSEDFRQTVDGQLETDIYYLPVPNDIFAAMANGGFFSPAPFGRVHAGTSVCDRARTFDYLHPRGLFRFKRRICDISSAPSIFQRVMDSTTRESRESSVV